jgi:predicted DNA-binding transcriptional regulator YafY
MFCGDINIYKANKQISTLMDFLKYTEKLNSLRYFIENRSAVTVNTLSNKLDVSGRTVMRMVENLRLQGVNIKYCKKRKSYVIE